MLNLRGIVDWLRNLTHRPDDRLRDIQLPSPDKNAEGQVKDKYKEVSRQTPNFSKGRVIHPTAVVLHHTSGSYAGGVSWCMNPASQVSYHVIIAPNGERTVLAGDNQRAWHAGVSEWKGRRDLNSWSLGVAFAGDTNKEPLTKEQIDSAIEYLLPRMKKLSLTIKDVTDHRTVSPNRKNDLKPSEFDRFMQQLKAHL
jgi:N-acetyl-anhydromuramoyl-L-alanine amidase